LAHIYSTACIDLRSKGQMSMSHASDMGMYVNMTA